VASMHRLTGAPIFLAITHPLGEIGKSLVEFREIESIKEMSRKLKDAPLKEFHGRLSTEINRQINRYLRIYPHLWEEIMNFGRFRLADKVRFEPGIKIHEFLDQIREKMISIINTSFEPDRKDEEILDVIQKNFPVISSALDKPSEILRHHKTKINLSLLDGISELLKLCNVAEKELKVKGQYKAAPMMKDLSIKLKKFIKQ